ncbi:MAG TPA: homoserine kinase [Actinomycetota bacterium]|jgi:homoserine kinase|nr:homoserine kinase [Actinomycetota bacterium]
MRLTARVPATSANLGPGFDCFGLALDLCNEVTIDTEADGGVTWEGEGADELPTDGTDLVSRAMRLAASNSDHSIPAHRLHGVNRIPLASGLGSSAAAAVAGVALARALLGYHSDAETTFGIAAALEGHPDNAAAASFGGLVIASGGQVERIDPHPDLRPVVLIPDGVRISTEDARRALPDTVARDDAVYNIGRSAMTIVALLRNPSKLPGALDDRLHQDARLTLAPTVRDVFRRLRAEGYAVCLSGSGPALLAFETDGRRIADPDEGWRVLRVHVRATGVEVFQS